MKRLELEDMLGDETTALVMNGFDKCIVGMVESFGQDPIACYDRDKVIKQHMDSGMSEEDAEEFFQYNQLGAGMTGSPCFITMEETK